jgi:CheY-like chemotaxis protein
MAPRVPYPSFWPHAIFICIGGFVAQSIQRGGNEVNIATLSVLDIAELLNRVDNDHELVSELFSIFKSVFPSHLQRLSDAVANEVPKQVETESHTLKGMLLNLSAACRRYSRRLGDYGARRENSRYERSPHWISGRSRNSVVADGIRRASTMKILIADDDPLSRHLLEKTLLRAGYDVVAVQNGMAAAEQLCKEDGPRLALLDWEMPELDGPGGCREVRKKKDQGYVYMILLTSKGSKTDIVAGLSSGADDYLTKPFDNGELKARLSVRSYDYVGRYGGEEFLIILNNCDPFSAPRRAEEIRKALSDHLVETSIGPLLVTMSMGVHQAENWGGQSVEELLHQVDSAMYAAKAAGRNRISFTKPDVSPDAQQVAPTEALRSLR